MYVSREWKGTYSLTFAFLENSNYWFKLTVFFILLESPKE